MLLAGVLLLLSQDTMISKLDALAKARDVEGLSRYLDNSPGRNPFRVLQTGGPYETGKYGWRAILLRMESRSFVIFSTPLTSEDIGELLFEVSANSKLKYIPEDFDNGEQITSHEITASFDLANKAAKLSDKIQLDQIGPVTYPPMLRLGPNYRVTKVTGADGKDVAFLQGGGIVVFPGLNPRETLTLHYAGQVNRPGFAGSITDKEVILTNDYWYPMIARKPAPYTITATTPSDWSAVGQGGKLSETSSSSMKVTKYKMDLPVTYYSFSASRYTATTLSSGGKKFFVFSNSMSPEDAKLQTEFYPSIINYFDSTIAPFPFGGYGAVVTPAYGGGALEAYSFATYGDGMLPSEEAHEPAHTWFGGIISNTYLHSLWNESFAVFCEGLYARNVPIGYQEERKRAFIQHPDIDPAFNVSPLNTASVFVGPAASSLGYGKGAYVLQMLENEMGTENLIKCMQEWIRVHPKNKGGEWEDFEAAVARVMKEDWTWFFDQWVRKAGWVDFDVKGLAWNAGKLSGHIYFRSDPYIVKCEVLTQGSEGTKLAMAQLSANLRDKDQKFVINCPVKPDLVSFDPWGRILRPIQEDEEPASISRRLENAKRYTDPQHRQYLKGMKTNGEMTTPPSDLNNTFIVGHPDTLPMLKPLCKKAGFEINGDALTYKGTTISLSKGAALAVVDLGNGKSCVIGLGQTRHRPTTGRANVAITDDLGRFLRGDTRPKTSGFLTFKL